MLHTLRPKQWAKNMLVFLGPLAAGSLAHWSAMWRTTLAFAIFCVVASGIYIVNDLKDIDEDRIHHQKRHRPIPSGDLPVRTAEIMAGSLMAVGLATSFIVLGWAYAALMMVYVLLSLSYSFGLKDVPVLEMGIVALGFTLRARAGGAALHLPFSPYVLFLAMTGAMFIVAGKRMSELNARETVRSTIGPCSVNIPGTS
jgi:decaprenyl-phosphate phosphoribosyltransferase